MNAREASTVSNTIVCCVGVFTEANMAIGTEREGDVCREGKTQSTYRKRTQQRHPKSVVFCGCSQTNHRRCSKRLVVSCLFQDECHNFIKVLVPRNDDLVFICGTNGFNPMCRYYRVSVQSELQRSNVSFGVCTRLLAVSCCS